jgi:hypothetical protein
MAIAATAVDDRTEPRVTSSRLVLSCEGLRKVYRMGEVDVRWTASTSRPGDRVKDGARVEAR